MIRSAREGMPDDAVNLHASAVVLDDEAVLVTGRSGSGKTRLALSLLEAWRGAGRCASLLADDQVFVMRRGDRLLARVPAAIAGLAEIRGEGIVPMTYVPEAAVGLIVDLGGGELPDGPETSATLQGIELPLLRLAAHPRDEARAAIAEALAAIRSPDRRESAAIMLASDNDLGLPTTERRTT